MKVQSLGKIVLIVGLMVNATALAYPCGFELGQRVVLAVDHPDGHPTLWKGMRGTIICFDVGGWWQPVLVSWDNWTAGHNNIWFCTTPILSSIANSCWWVYCDEISSMPRVPDLLDGGEPHRYFQPQTLLAGKTGQTLEVGFLLRNGGEGDPDDGIYANIYLSQDTHVTNQDYYLGYVSCYISGNGAMKMTWKRAFPAHIPPGIYYVGWVIDPDNLIDNEYDETNNQACLTSYRLTVSGPADQPGLEISAATGGAVTNPGEGVFTYLTAKSLPVAASPDPDGSFFAWTGTAVDAGKVADRYASSTNVLVDARYTLTALFRGPHVAIENFERFSDPCNVMSEIWVDGISFSEGQKGHFGNGTGATVGSAEQPSPDNPTIHGGTQSMAFGYENGSKPWYSEVERTWDTLQNWQGTGATELSIWYRGAAGNRPESLYVTLADCMGASGVSVHPDSLAALRTEWSRWSIPLAEFENQGIMLSRITKMSIGAGNRSKPVVGGHGTLYIDDITLEFEPGAWGAK